MELPTHVFLDAKRYNLVADSIVLCENPQRMSKTRLIKKLTVLDQDALRNIAVASLLATSVIAFLS